MTTPTDIYEERRLLVNDDYETCHDAMDILWRAYSDAIESRIGRGVIVNAIKHLRERAYDAIPYGATLPNKGWNGKRVG